MISACRRTHSSSALCWLLPEAAWCLPHTSSLYSIERQHWHSFVSYLFQTQHYSSFASASVFPLECRGLRGLVGLLATRYKHLQELCLITDLDKNISSSPILIRKQGIDTHIKKEMHKPSKYCLKAKVNKQRCEL